MPQTLTDCILHFVETEESDAECYGSAEHPRAVDPGSVDNGFLLSTISQPEMPLRPCTDRDDVRAFVAGEPWSRHPRRLPRDAPAERTASAPDLTGISRHHLNPALTLRRVLEIDLPTGQARCFFSRPGPSREKSSGLSFSSGKKHDSRPQCPLSGGDLSFVHSALGSDCLSGPPDLRGIVRG